MRKLAPRRAIAVTATVAGLAIVFATAATAHPAWSGSVDAGTVNVVMDSNLTGVAAANGGANVNGVQMAIDDLNKKGGLLGKQIQLYTADDALNVQTGTTNLTNMVTGDHPVAIFGPGSSAVAVAAQQIANQYKLPLIEVGANDPSLMGQYFTKYAFQIPPNNYMETRALARYLGPSLPRIYTIGADYVSGHSYVNNFLKGRDDFNYKYQLLGQQWPPVTETTFDNYISAALAAKPDFVFLGIFAGGLTAFVKQAERYDFFKNIQVGGLFTVDLLETLGSDAPAGALAMQRAPFYAIPAAASFAARYKQRFGQWPNDWGIMGYEGVQAWAAAVNKTHSFNGDKVAAALSGATVKTLSGKMLFRKCDHQAEVPVYIGKIGSTVVPKYGFPILTNIKKSWHMYPCSVVQAQQPHR